MTINLREETLALIQTKMNSGSYSDVDSLLQDALHALDSDVETIDEELEESLADLEQGIADAQAGRTRPLSEVIKDMDDRARQITQ